ncbi:hypothetical protein LBMAG42_24870 [Deltaproteobacteria bacterium]|nr:hypothetical protein LBMAG42_24870 [Deltaproteobacteria bacterium]
MRFLSGNTAHPTAHDVFAAVNAEHPDASRATVYSTLALLVELGALVPIRHGEAETRYDPNVSSHHHTECPRCGRLDDVAGADVEVRFRGWVTAATVRFSAVCGACSITPPAAQPGSQS